MTEQEHLNLLAQIASLYYEKNCTQQQIAIQFGYSRSMISRLLSEAQQKGVVEVRVHYPLERCTDLEVELQNKLGLKAAQVLVRGTLNYDQTLRKLGALAAQFVDEKIAEGMVVGVSWGTALREVINSFKNRNYAGIKVVQIIGALDTPDPEIDGPDLAIKLARILGGHYLTLPAPLIVDNESTRDALMNDQRLQRILGMVDSMQMALMGIGTLDSHYSSLVRAGYLAPEHLIELINQGAVGDVCAIHFDLKGNILDIPMNKRRVGISPEKLRNIPIKLGVAGGEAKALPIVGASRAGLINHLIADELAALQAIRVMEGERNV